MTAFALFALVAFAIGLFIAYRVGASHARTQFRSSAKSGKALSERWVDAQPEKSLTDSQTSEEQDDSHVLPNVAMDARRGASSRTEDRTSDMQSVNAALPQLRDFADDRRRLIAELADARAELARYREIVVDIERNAPPLLLDTPGAPDDLKLIVGVGPVIERMLHQLGIGTYRQIAHWTERDIDAFDARLSDFPGRIRRDQWVTQARALHLSKYGTPP